MKDLQQAMDVVRALRLESGVIDSVEFRPEGSFPPAMGIDFGILPAHVRVYLTLSGGPGSLIRAEVWMPTENWNGMFQGTGNGGGGGGIEYASLMGALQMGYACANNDMGTSEHQKPERISREVWEDFGYRATHLTTVEAKKIVAAFYGRQPEYSLFLGCSSGGQQALAEAQRYPEDYDGIIAAKPARNRIRLYGYILRNLRATADLGLTMEQLQLLQERMVEECAAQSGGEPGDRFLSYPHLCSFDFDSLNQHGFTGDQIGGLKKVFLPAAPNGAEEDGLRMPLGSHMSGLGLYFQSNPGYAMGLLFGFYWFFGADFDWRTCDIDRALEEMDAAIGPLVNACDPDLSAFRNAGGKLILLAGTADPCIPYMDTVQYYEDVAAQMGGREETEKFCRLFVIPGAGHGIHGPGLCDVGTQQPPTAPKDREHNVVAAMEAWLREGTAPDRLTAYRFENSDHNLPVTWEREVYPWPRRK